MARLGYRSKEFLQLPPLFLGWPAESPRKMKRRVGSLIARPGVLFGRSHIFEELADKLGADALSGQREHLHRAPDATCKDVDLFARADITGRFHVFVADLDVTGVAGIRSQRTALEKADRPQPFVDANARLHERQGKRCRARCNLASFCLNGGRGIVVTRRGATVENQLSV